MNTGHYLKARVTPELKRSVRQAAVQQQITESIWVRQALTKVLQQHAGPDSLPASPCDAPQRNARLYVRLRRDDQRLLSERAARRGMAPGTYVSLLVRAHLTGVAPIPQAELEAFRQSLKELAIAQRYTQAMAQVTQQRGQLHGMNGEVMKGLIKILTAAHDRFKALLAANLKSWETGHGP